MPRFRISEHYYRKRYKITIERIQDLKEECVKSMEHTIIFQPSGRRDLVPEGTTILDAARKLGVGSGLR
jgi:hypothetical protein